MFACARGQAVHSAAISPGWLHREHTQRVSVLTGGGGLGGSAPGEELIGIRPIGGVCSPLPNGYGPESSQNHCPVDASQRCGGPATPPSADPAPRLPPCWWRRLSRL